MSGVDDSVNGLIVNPEDKELDFESNRDVIVAFWDVVKRLEMANVSKWVIIQEFQNKLDRFIDEVRGIDRSRNPSCWVMANALAIRQETSELIDGLDWKHWKVSEEKINREYMLEELADILHFYVSMLISLGKNLEDLYPSGELLAELRVDGVVGVGDCKVKDSDVVRFVLYSDKLSVLAMGIYELGVGLSGLSLEGFDYLDGVLMKMFGYILLLNEALGFSEEDLYRLYLKKNLKNFLRQLSQKFRGGSYFAGDKRDIAVDVIKNVWFFGEFVNLS